MDSVAVTEVGRGAYGPFLTHFYPSQMLPLFATTSSSLLMDNHGVRFKARSMETHFLFIPVAARRLNQLVLWQ